jgi:hypothetical protein
MIRRLALLLLLLGAAAPARADEIQLAVVACGDRLD